MNKISIEKLKSKNYNLVEELILQEHIPTSFEGVLYNYKINSKPKEFSKIINGKNKYLVSFTSDKSKELIKPVSKVEKTQFAKFIEKIQGSKRTFTVERTKISKEYKKELSLLDIAVLKGNKNLISKVLLHDPKREILVEAKKYTENKDILAILNNKINNLELKKKPKRNESLRRKLILDNVAKIENRIHKNKGKLRDTCKLYQYYPTSQSVQTRLNELLGYKKTKQFNIKEFCNNLEKLIKKVD